MTILYDHRWRGTHGIGRFATEVRKHLSRMAALDVIEQGPDPLSAQDPLWLSWKIQSSRSGVYFNPGFNVPLVSKKPFVFTIHDLIHVHVPEERSKVKEVYYQRLVRPKANQAHRVLTVSEYSRKQILDWTGLAPERVVVVGNGVDAAFSPQGPRVQPGYDYVLCVANPKPHKNIHRLLKAWSLLKTDLKLALTGKPHPELVAHVEQYCLQDRVVFLGLVPEQDLPAWYRSAAAVVLPSTYEGFGLPPLEGMASGVPVVVANATSLPEVVGDAALLFDPLNPESIAHTLELILRDTQIRQQCIERGLQRATQFSWPLVAQKIHQVLQDAHERTSS